VIARILWTENLIDKRKAAGDVTDGGLLVGVDDTSVAEPPRPPHPHP